MKALSAALIFAFVASAGIADAQCGQPGVMGVPSIRLSSPATGRAAEFRVRNGAPSANWIAVVDIVGGPTTLPFGTLCVGPAPTLLFNSFTGTVPPLDVDGAVDVPIAIPAAFGTLEGIPFHYQALVVDPTAPSGISISANLVRAFRRPRVFVSSSVPDNAYVTAIEPTSGAPDYDLPFARGVDRIIASAQEGRVAMVLGRRTPQDQERLVIVDDESGDVLYTRSESLYADVALAHDDRTLVAVVLRNGTWVLRTIDLSAFDEVDLPLTTSPGQLIPHPDRDVVFIASPFAELTPMNFRSGALLPTVVTGLVPDGWPVGTRLSFAVDGTVLYLGSLGDGWSHNAFAPGVATIDLVTGTLTNVSFLSLVDAPLTDLVFATGTNGPGLFVRAPGGVKELDPVTLAVRRTIAQSGAMALSAGGSELYFLDDGSLRVLDLVTDSVTPIFTTTDAMSDPLAVPGRVYFVDDRDLYGVDTDPFGVPQLVTSLATGPNLPNRILFRLAAD